MDCVKSVEFIDDIEKPAPLAAHPEIWRSIIESVSGISEEPIQGSLAKHLGQDSFEEECDDVRQYYGEEALIMASDVRIYYKDGTVDVCSCTGAFSHFFFELEFVNIRDMIRGVWAVIGERADRDRYFNSEQILLIEYPLELQSRHYDDETRTT